VKVKGGLDLDYYYGMHISLCLGVDRPAGLEREYIQAILNSLVKIKLG
jgi:hypothetical protein